ncbi:MAG: hypothetical protein JWN98_2457 [Abditibacteriota bacterium]|nr:hypothetical protein [Abditibacteriota bacterium]
MAQNVNCTPVPPTVDGVAGARYSLPGPQVEPGAAYWTSGPCAVPSVIRISELLALTDDAANPDFYFEPYPSDPKVIAREIAELKQLAADLDKPLPRGTISQYLQLRPQPLGAVFCLEREQKPLTTLDQQCTLDRQDDPPVIQTGRELARWFEAETPGLGHRHALNCLILSCDLSPVRQARIWMALDVAIYSALIAAWHYKWASDRPCTAYRPRPWEVDNSVSVLYDKCVKNTGCGDDGNDPFPPLSPGSPRHPAYPSGHSTVGGAGSEILKYFFTGARERAELDKLADNSGMARLWAGIHYRSDHEQGLKLGRSVARLVISQLESDGVPLPSKPPAPTPANGNRPAPSKEQVRAEAYALRKQCLKPASRKSGCFPPSDRGCTGGESAPVNRSVQQGAR